ncbi:hypothetical protein [Almyronema epifaneia]|uniref:Uncharacterized protein n=1 Tax=Almyronema epifaneia S1 TaxID=2991925 RepID=A0ABW6IHM6_9CYAN
MQTRLVTFEVALPASVAELQHAIAIALAAHGDPLRWAITQVNQQQVWVEAVVLIPG